MIPTGTQGAERRVPMMVEGNADAYPRGDFVRLTAEERSSGGVVGDATTGANRAQREKARHPMVGSKG